MGDAANEARDKAGTLPGFALLGCPVSSLGVAAVAVAKGDPAADALGLLAAACAFGQLVGAAWRR